MLIISILATEAAKRTRRACVRGVLTILAVATVVSSASAAGARFPKLDNDLEHRAVVASTTRTSTVIVSLTTGSTLPAEFRKYARPETLDTINAMVLDVPDSVLGAVSRHSAVSPVHHETIVRSNNFRTGITSGAFFARRDLGFDGTGVAVAVVDSGIYAAHDDLSVAKFLDFVGPHKNVAAYDDAGHGTHVSGTIAGNGHDSGGKQSGMAPGATLYSLKALDATGAGKLTDVLAALNWLAKNAAKYHIRVVNLSFGTAVTESYWDDPLTLATKALVDRDVVVVVAGGNNGEDDHHHKVWVGITSPGNAPWVITVGSSSTHGSLTRKDDTLSTFSSRGPSPIDYNAKPDLLASGEGTVSTAAPGSYEYGKCLTAVPTCLVDGTSGHGASPYMALTGTSMAAPVVTGTVAQMLQANPKLTPNLVKAILMYTAEQYPGYKLLEQGAGFLNSLGAVRLAQFYKTAHRGALVPVEPIWSKQVIWGTHRLHGGIMVPSANAWKTGVVWGSPKAFDDGDNIVWGTACGAPDCGDRIVWGTADGDNIVWGTDDGDNIVWGTSEDGDNIVWGTSEDGDNIVWGTDCGGNDCGPGFVWGSPRATSDGDNIVWGTADGDNIVWGTADGDNIVWGTSDGDNIVWGTADGDNIVWGTDDGDNIVWGTDDGDNIVWGTSLRGHKRAIIVTVPGVNPSFEWFLDFRNDAAWMQQEFGDTFKVPGLNRR